MQLTIIIYYMWDYLSFSLVADDVAQQEASDRAVKSLASDITYSRGNVAVSD